MLRRRRMKRLASQFFFLLTILMVLSAMPLIAQEQTGVIEGIIKDPTGAVLPGVTVEATSSGSGTIVATSDAKGAYRFPRVPPGVYNVKATLVGYKPAGAR